MKKLNVLLSMVLLTGTVFFTSCTKDEGTDVGNPSLTLKSGTDYTSDDKTVQLSETILVGVNGSQNSASGNNLTAFKLTAVNTNVPTVVFDTTFNSESFDWEIELSFSNVGIYSLVFELTDDAGNTAEESIDINVENSALAVNSYLNIELGSYNAQQGSFFSTTDAQTYTITQLRGNTANQAKVDFLFFKGASNLNSLASPDNAAAATLAELELAAWTNKNETRFNTTTITAAQFDAIGDTYMFPAFNSTTQTSIVNNLAVGQVVLFRTEAGKLGLVKIDDLYTRADYTQIDVIIQQ